MAAQFYHEGVNPNENLFNNQIKLVPILEKFFNHNSQSSQHLTANEHPISQESRDENFNVASFSHNQHSNLPQSISGQESNFEMGREQDIVLNYNS